MDARPVKVSADASLVFPLIVSQTFYKEMVRRQDSILGNKSIATTVYCDSDASDNSSPEVVSEAKVATTTHKR